MRKKKPEQTWDIIEIEEKRFLDTTRKKDKEKQDDN